MNMLVWHWQWIKQHATRKDLKEDNIINAKHYRLIERRSTPTTGQNWEGFLTALPKLNLINLVAFKLQMKLHSRFICWYPGMCKSGGKRGQRKTATPKEYFPTTALVVKAVGWKKHISLSSPSEQNRKISGGTEMVLSQTYWASQQTK